MVFTLMVDTIQHLKTHQLVPSFTKVLNMHITQFFGEKVVLLLGLTDDHELNFMLIPMTHTKIDIVSSVHQSDGLEDCMNKLDDFINNSKLDELIKPSPSKTHEKIIQSPKEAEEFTPGPEAALRQNTPEEFSSLDDLEEETNKVLEQLKQLEVKTQNLKPLLSEALANHDVIVDGKVLIQGSLNAEKLKASSIRTKKLNGINWEPERWLSTSGNQIITTPMYINSLKVSDLEVHNDNGLFKGI